MCQELCAIIPNPYASLGGAMPQLSAKKTEGLAKATGTQEQGRDSNAGGVTPEPGYSVGSCGLRRGSSFGFEVLGGQSQASPESS